MTIVLSRSEPEPFQRHIIKQFRRVFRVNRDGIFLGWQNLWVDESEWKDCDHGYWIVLQKWETGVKHIYWDGEHCLYALGWIGVSRNGYPCEKCMPSSNKTTP